MGKTSLSLAISGSGGTGVMTAGSLLLEAAAAAGYYGLMSRTLGPQIRGGEAAALLRIGCEMVACPDDSFDILLAINWGNIERFIAELPVSAKTLIIADPAQGPVPPALLESGAHVLSLPLAAIADTVPEGRVNTVALGILGQLAGLPEAVVEAQVTASLADKDPTQHAAALAAVKAGVAALEGCGAAVPLAPPTGADKARWLISGNEASGAGALRGGVKFVAAYPITPATEILEWLAPRLPKVGGALVQAEDELASINMIIGASYGGAPALTATSGPGLSLMTESIGLGVAAEIPIVICNVMRGGPSTGIPTKSEQADLNIAVYGLHGDAPHVVTAPNSIADCVFTTQWSVHLAESMQVPVIVLSDQAMGQSRAVIDPPGVAELAGGRKLAVAADGPYRRYALCDDGISPMALPGTPGLEYTADGLEHNPRGTPSTQAAHHREQLQKRQDKIRRFDYGAHWADVEGAGRAAIITWGSVTAAAREAAHRLRGNGQAVRLISLRLLAPALPDALAAALEGVERALVVEQSHSLQFFHYLRSAFDLPALCVGHGRPGPVPIAPGEIVVAFENLLGTRRHD